MHSAHHSPKISKWFFLKEFLNKPRRIGSAVPSSQRLARQMIAKLGAKDHELVVELGPGTGVFTREILRSGVRPENLILVEFNPQFAEFLKATFPQVKVVAGDAGALPDILRSLKIDKVKRIVSGIPFRSLPVQARIGITEAIANSLKVGGVAVQFTYAGVPPFPKDVAARVGLMGSPVARVFANFPPAIIWRYVKSN